MKFISVLTEVDRAALETVHHDAKTHRQRQRAHAVLLSGKGFTVPQMADIFSVDRDTISGWLDTWQERGLDGLADAPKPGRRRKIDAVLEAELLDLLQHPTPDLKAVVQAHLKKKTSGSAGGP